MNFDCRHEDWSDASWKQTDARDAEEAAEKFADRYWSDEDNPDELSVLVRGVNGVVQRFNVRAEQCVVFHATPGVTRG
jgi:hypothetical protein